MKRKVLFVVSGLNIGGLELYLLRFVKQYYQELEVTILCKRNHSGALEEEFIQLSIPIINVRIGYIDFRSWYKFYKVIKFGKFDTVCDFTGDFAGVVLMLSYFGGISRRLVFYRGSRHQFINSTFNSIYSKISHSLTWIFSNGVLSNSSFALEVFFGQGYGRKLKKFQVIKNGIRIFEPSGKIQLDVPDQSFIIGHVGRFSSAKNHETIIQVANYLCNKYQYVYFLLCGKGVEDGIGDLCRNFDLHEKVIMPGMCTDMYPWYMSMDAFIFPSINEGQPNALLEALSFGIPAVTSNIPTILECTPDLMNSHRIDPCDIRGYIELLESIVQGKKAYDYQLVKKWVVSENDPKVRLQEFYEQL